MKHVVFPTSPGELAPIVSPSSPGRMAGMTRSTQHLTKSFSFAGVRGFPARDALEVPGSAPPSGTSIIATLGLVLALTVIGDAVAVGLELPVPGAAIGMLMLASIFAVRGGADPASGRIFDAAAPHFPLFFVPAAAGIVASADLLTRSWVSIAAAIILGTAITLIITGALTQILLRRFTKVKTP